MIVGYIDFAEGTVITGWVYSLFESITPIITVDGLPAKTIEYPLVREDVSLALKNESPTGFKAVADNIHKGSLVELFAMQKDKVVPLAKFICQHGFNASTDFKKIMRASEIAQCKDAVAVTCWDAAHNPIGRAKVLYDIIKAERPAMLFSFVFDNFGGKLWEPLQNSDIEILLIPWAQRHLYAKIFTSLKINFDTIWMCKPRLPTFLLSKCLSHADTKLIIDLDDNEEHFSMSKSSQDKIYGLISVGQSRDLLDHVVARTTASISLNKKYGGNIVRHVRNQTALSLNPDKTNPKVVFAGTVRPHKGIVKAAKGISLFNFLTGSNVEFYVYGDIKPDTMRDELKKAGAHVNGIVPQDNLMELISRYDAVLTGFHDSNSDNEPITKYQITSKIGDALAVGRPALVPSSPSVEDLATTEGIFIFDETNFVEQMRNVLQFQGDAKLPPEFTVEGAYKAFKDAEKIAQGAARAGEVFSRWGKIISKDDVALQDSKKKPTLLLIWKQQDAGIYGRRIDQLARSYSARYPDHKTVVLQFCHDNVLKDLKSRSENPFSEAELILERVNLYARSGYGGWVEGGVHYDMVRHSTDGSLKELLMEYLCYSDIYPENSVVVLFPLVPAFPHIRDVISAYPIIVDVVDNQLSWQPSSKIGRGLISYHNHFSISNNLIFNSVENRDYFVGKFGITDGEDNAPKVIENWYSLYGSDFSDMAPLKVSPDCMNIIYSGNSNDRVDFDLIAQVTQSIGGVKIHIFGSAERAPQAFKDVCALENVIYYGPRPEKNVAAALISMDLAIMPHIDDEISRYMNPLKVKMYAKFGLTCLSTNVKGVEGSDNVVVCSNSFDFLNRVARFRDEFAMRSHRSKSIPMTPIGSANQGAPLELSIYFAEIERLRVLQKR